MFKIKSLKILSVLPELSNPFTEILKCIQKSKQRNSVQKFWIVSNPLLLKMHRLVRNMLCSIFHTDWLQNSQRSFALISGLNNTHLRLSRLHIFHVIQPCKQKLF